MTSWSLESALLHSEPFAGDIPQAWRALRGLGGLTVREVACAGAVGTLLVADRVPGPQAPWVTLAAFESRFGAAPSALLSIARDGLLPNQFAYRLWPSVNPGGELPRRGGPELRAIATANRDRHFCLGIELRESELAAFTCAGDAGADGDQLARALTCALDDAGYRVDCAYAGDRHAPLLPQRLTARSLVFIAPARSSQEDRVAMFRIATTAALVATHSVS